MAHEDARDEKPRTRAKAWAAGIDAARRRAGFMLPAGLVDITGWLRHLLSQWALAEVAPGRLVPWLPVAFGFGIVGYFTADREPAWWAASALALAGFVAPFWPAGVLSAFDSRWAWLLLPPALPPRRLRQCASRIPYYRCRHRA